VYEQVRLLSSFLESNPLQPHSPRLHRRIAQYIHCRAARVLLALRPTESDQKTNANGLPRDAVDSDIEITYATPLGREAI
jgi:hypothetical protein